MRTLNAEMSKSYRVCIGRKILRTTATHLKKLGFSSRAVIITNKTVNKLYGSILEENLNKNGFEILLIEVPDTERSKSMGTALRIYDELISHKIERETPVIAFGGGVVGDLAGYVSATFLRGLPLIHLPTTLLAQVDSCIGGKTAVNYLNFKNIVGVFKNPEIVLIDPDLLQTLPEREIKNGVAEIIKYGVIGDPSLFSLLEKRMDDIFESDPLFLEEIIYRCCKIKIDIVEKDERETGLRRILNYGHTIGHAIETASNFAISHGEAVAIGMCAAGRIAEKLGIFNDVERQERLIKRAGFSINLSDFDVEDLIRIMHFDKKVKNSKINFVLPRRIGDVVIRDNIPEKVLLEIIEGLR